PFVKRAELDAGARPLQAIKALHLDRKNPTDIIRHADDWRNVVSRLRSYGTAPDELLFVLQGPHAGDGSHARAFDQVRHGLAQGRIPRGTADAAPDILPFAAR